MARPLIDEGVSVNAIGGQLSIERPGSGAPLDMGEFLTQTTALGVEELTIVDLRSADGTMRMCQEFYGRIEGQERITYMVGAPGSAAW